MVIIILIGITLIIRRKVKYKKTKTKNFLPEILRNGASTRVQVGLIADARITQTVHVKPSMCIQNKHNKAREGGACTCRQWA